MKMQWESARKVDASDCAYKVKRIFQLNSIRVSERETEFLSVSLNTKTVAWMKMAFNGGCDTDGPHNKRLCTGQNIVSVNDNNNNTNGGALLGNGLVGGDVDMKGLGLLRVNYDIILNMKSFTQSRSWWENSDWNLTPNLDLFPPLPCSLLTWFPTGAINRHEWNFILSHSRLWPAIGQFSLSLWASTIIQFVMFNWNDWRLWRQTFVDADWLTSLDLFDYE